MHVVVFVFSFFMIFSVGSFAASSDDLVPPHSPATTVGIAPVDTQKRAFLESLDRWIADIRSDTDRSGIGVAEVFAHLTAHIEAEAKRENWRYRKDILLDYLSYGSESGEISLRECGHVVDGIKKTLCLGKGTMFLHMLRKTTGDDVFFDTVKNMISRYDASDVSWDDVKVSFEKSTGRGLGTFFGQWVDRKGLLDFSIQNQRIFSSGAVRMVSFDIVQNGDPYEFRLPVIVRKNGREVEHVVDVQKETQRVELPVDVTPTELVIDRGYDLMRRLSPDESPPLVARLFGDQEKIVVVTASCGALRSFLAPLEARGFSIREAEDLRDEEVRSHALLICGFANRLVNRLYGGLGVPSSGFTMTVRSNPLNRSKVIAIAHADTSAHIPSVEDILEFSRYSFLQFHEGVLVLKRIDDAQRGIAVKFPTRPLIMRPVDLNDLDDTLDSVLGTPLIYVGERHANFEDHRTQLDIIARLAGKNRPFAVGMEMFQRPFQKHIDDYLSGDTSEREFLKRTEYFKRWQFDYHLYREIVEFAKAKKIPIVALNLRTEIIKKVSAEGLDSLSGAERDELPVSIDMTDDDYRRRLEEIFQQHKNRESRSFDNFYQAQILWDETMAESIHEYLSRNPGYQMVVLAGSGHLMYGSGIPKRVYRRNQKDFAIILPGEEPVDRDVADYLVFSEPLEPPPTLKLGIVAKESGDGVVVEKVVPGSIAKSTGIREGDIIRALDDWKIDGIDDVHIFMLDKKRGDPFSITISRKRFLFGYRQIVLKGTI